MSSLYRPFCVSDAPCEDAVWRRGCTSPQHPAVPSSAPPPVRLGVLASRLTPVHNMCEGKRRFAAAATGGRKITHPGKAILAGTSMLEFLFRQAFALPSQAAAAVRAHSITPGAQKWVKRPCSHLQYSFSKPRKCLTYSLNS